MSIKVENEWSASSITIEFEENVTIIYDEEERDKDYYQFMLSLKEAKELVFKLQIAIEQYEDLERLVQNDPSILKQEQK